MADKQAIVNNFKSVTGASDEEAKFFLEANQWDLDLATSAFLDSEDASSPPHRAAPQQAHAPQQAQAPAPQPKASSKSKAPQRGGVATLRDFGSKDEESDEEDEDVQKYYAGGQKSGQMIHYPKEKGKGNDDVVNQVFEGAKKQGAKPVDENKPAAPSYFGGQGFKLGDNVTQSAPVKPAAQPAKRPEVQKTITFWRNGFSVDNGPLRSLDDPANQEFLAEVHRGVVPRELEQGVQQGTLFSVNLVDNRQQEYKEPPKPKVSAFSGQGQALGSTASTTTTTTTAQAAQPPPASSGSFSVDETKPTTSIQLRLGDGTRLVSKFNHTHTVGDIRRFVDAARRGAQRYELMTTFPQKVLSDNSQTIADAGLINAVIVQKML